MSGGKLLHIRAPATAKARSPTVTHCDWGTSSWCVICCVHTVHSLGVIFDCELSMKLHIIKLQVLVFFHLRRLQQLRGVVTDEIMKQ